MAMPNAHMLVDVEWLRTRLEDPGLRIIDCGWDGAAYGRAHIPGAVRRPGHAYVKQLRPDGKRGTRVTEIDDFRELCQKMGIAADSDVILYDDWGGLYASRLWWVLRYYGFDRVRVLDGGWQAWVSAGAPVSFTVPTVPQTEPLHLHPHPERIISSDDLLEEIGKGSLQVFDVRTDDEYEGRNDRGNARAGRLPGAINLEWNLLLENSSNQKAVRTLRPEAELRDLIEGVGIDPGRPVVTHCQAAIRATHTAFVLELMGFPPVKVYDGSAEEWANREDTPLE